MQLNKFKKSPGRKWQKSVLETRTPLLVILLTPGHIKLLDKPDENIGAHLLALCPEAQTQACEMDVLIAVVDRIPHVLMNQRFRSSPDVPNRGSEGMSVAYLDSADATPDLWDFHTTATEEDNMTIQQRCSVSFAIQNEGDPRSMQKLQLPVANTLFLNGKTSTLLAQRWLWHPSHGKVFKLVNEKALPEQVINLTYPSQSVDPNLKNGLRTFLTPITEPRTVVASVGNIVREIQLGDNSKASPASQELETAIQKRIRDGEMPNDHTNVWALITPKGIRASSRTISHRAFYKGCQLRKVLSGGGGWGVKQGLLSLDPDADYKSLLTEPPATKSTTFQELYLENHRMVGIQDDETQCKKMFENIINPGDTITFLVNKLAEDPVLEPDSSRSHPHQYSRDLSYNLLQFGTLPSTIDARPVTADRLQNVRAPRKAVFIKNCFGMLSEQGMSFEVSLA